MWFWSFFLLKNEKYETSRWGPIENWAELRSLKMQHALININVSACNKCCSLAINMEMTEKETIVLQPSVIDLVKRGKFSVYRRKSCQKCQKSESLYRDKSHHRDNLLRVYDVVGSSVPVTPAIIRAIQYIKSMSPYQRQQY